MKRKYGFVVLNYNNAKDTIDCINSILSIDDNNYELVVVDNCSTDNSYEELKNRFLDSVNIIKSDKNGGYSYGNNVGIKFLLKKEIKNICIATSDTIVLSKDILRKLDDIKLDEVGIIGPYITTPFDTLENPVIKNLRFLYILNLYFPKSMAIIRKLIYLMLPFLFSLRHSRIQGNKIKLLSEEVYMVHGSFLIVTENYINKIGLLDESLFMYGEEDIIAYECYKNNLRVLYNVDIKVLHKGEASTINVYKGNTSSFRAKTEKNSNKYLQNKLKFWVLINAVFKK